MRTANTTTELTLKRLAPGNYIALVGGSELDRYYIRRARDEWYLTYPGELYPDDVYATLADAKAAALQHMEEEGR